MWKAYGASKSANILFSAGLVHRFGAKGLQSFSVHPGGKKVTTTMPLLLAANLCTVISTQLFRDLNPEEYDRNGTYETTSPRRL
jgi:NAD(P)-dependent dehydrogenase (short-subunit alcohol dehydrogenase family)